MNDDSASLQRAQAALARPGSGEVVDLEEWRRKRGLPPARMTALLRPRDDEDVWAAIEDDFEVTGDREDGAASRDRTSS